MSETRSAGEARATCPLRSPVAVGQVVGGGDGGGQLGVFGPVHRDLEPDDPRHPSRNAVAPEFAARPGVTAPAEPKLETA